MGWTRNYYNLLTAFLLGDSTETSVNVPVDYQPPIVYKRTNGTYSNMLPGTYAEYSAENPQGAYQDTGYQALFAIGKRNLNYRWRENSDTTQEGGTSIQFGTGDTAATYEDYCLEAPITSDVTLVQQSGTRTAPSAFDAVTHKYSSTRTFTVNNSGTSSITIKELGIFCLGLLVYREVLDSPITIDPGESVTVSFTREATVFNYTPY